jgi:hypothetical protein
MAKSVEIGNKCSKRRREEMFLKSKPSCHDSLATCHDGRSKQEPSILDISWHDDSLTCHDGAICQPVSAIDLLTSVHLMSKRATMGSHRGTMEQSVGHYILLIKGKLGRMFWTQKFYGILSIEEQGNEGASS